MGIAASPNPIGLARLLAPIARQSVTFHPAMAINSETIMRTRHFDTLNALLLLSPKLIRLSYANPNAYMTSFNLKLHLLALRIKGEL